ncbi:MAG: AsmA family protein [Acetobacteraceae bacterium]
MHRTVRISLIAIAGVTALAAAGIGVAVATFDPNSLKPRIIEAVHKATGRDLTIGGDIRLRPSLWPTVEVADVSLSNPPGFSRPQMATLKQMRLSLALLPLLSREVEIDSLTLVQPDILLERKPDGQANWQFAQAIPPPASGPTSTAPSEPRRGLLIGVQSLGIENGAAAYRDGVSGFVTRVGIPALTMTAATPSTPLHVEGTATYNDVPIAVTADTGSLARLQRPADTTPWPVKLILEAASARIAAEGAVSRPNQGQGYDIAVTGTVGDTAALAPLLPGSRIPSVRDVSFGFRVADRGQGQPEVSAATLRAGSGTLGNGFVLDRVDLTTTGLDQPVQLDVTGSVNGAPVGATGSVGSALRQPIPIDLALRLGDEKLAVKGNVAAGPGGFGSGVALHGMTVNGKLLDLGGDVDLAMVPRISLTGTVNASHIDADGLAAIGNRLSTPPPAAAAAAQAGSTPPTASTPPAAERRPRSDRIFPDAPLPFALLKEADANLTLTIGTLRAYGQDYRRIETHVALLAGRLTVDPLKGDLPEGRMEGALTVDASQAEPPVHLRLRAPGLALRAVLAALRQPPVASGNMEVYADLSGAGASPRAIASTLNGTLGVAVPGGTIDNRLLGSILGSVMNQFNALDLVGRGGGSELRCFALRADAHQGVATIRTLDLSSSLATVTGAGTVNLGAETLDLTLRPEARIAGNIIVIPMQVSGPIRNPSTRVNEIKSLESNAASVAGAVIGNATPLGAIGGLLGAGRVIGGGDICPAALAAARGQAAPAAPAQGLGKLPEAVQKLPVPNLPDPTKSLRNLFR